MNEIVNKKSFSMNLFSLFQGIFWFNSDRIRFMHFQKFSTINILDSHQFVALKTVSRYSVSFRQLFNNLPHRILVFVIFMIYIDVCLFIFEILAFRWRPIIHFQSQPNVWFLSIRMNIWIILIAHSELLIQCRTRTD